MLSYCEKWLSVYRRRSIGSLFRGKHHFLVYDIWWASPEKGCWCHQEKEQVLKFRAARAKDLYGKVFRASLLSGTRLSTVFQNALNWNGLHWRLTSDFTLNALFFNKILTQTKISIKSMHRPIIQLFKLINLFSVLYVWCMYPCDHSMKGEKKLLCPMLSYSILFPWVGICPSIWN